MLREILRNTLVGGSYSLAALIVGNCEGTRDYLGGFTEHYYGHTDPGDGRGNLGSFSTRDMSTSDPQTADTRWQLVLEDELLPVFIDWHENFRYNEFHLLSLWFNCVDLYTQAPLAVVAKMGLLDRITIDGYKEMSELRAESYIDEFGVLHASGFGNSFPRLLSDQVRRVNVINSFLKAY